VSLHSLIIGSARQHLAQPYDILGVSHRVRFASTWETQDPAKGDLLLDVFRKRGQTAPSPRSEAAALRQRGRTDSMHRRQD
jgi:hypothetical protein